MLLSAGSWNDQGTVHVELRTDPVEETLLVDGIFSPSGDHVVQPSTPIPPGFGAPSAGLCVLGEVDVEQVNGYGGELAADAVSFRWTVHDAYVSLKPLVEADTQSRLQSTADICKGQ